MRALSLVQLEHGLIILGELDLEPIVEAFSAFGPVLQSGSPIEALQEIKIKPGQIKEFAPVLKTLAMGGKLRTLRRLAAVAMATDDELLAAEGSETKMAELNAAAARLGYVDGLVEAFGFFFGLGLFPGPSLASPEEGEGTPERETAPAPGGDTPSVAS